jgi:hypothetical protein
VKKMWYAVTENPVKRTRKEKRKEFMAARYEIILNAESRAELENKLSESIRDYPDKMKRYLEAGIKYVEAGNPQQAKKRAPEVNIYFDQRGQYKFL